MEDSPIGMFDSGVGGLTVMKELVRVLPYENILYFGDTARLPYGAKSPETIIRYSIENSIFLIDKKIKMLVVACNTASAHALACLQERFDIPVIGVVDPGAESAVRATKQGRIGVLGTKGTINSQCYQKAILKKDSKVSVFPIACPLFVPFVEENCLDHPAIRLVIKEYLKPLKDYHIDTLLLGCTHYPLLKELIQEEVGEDILIVDSALSCSEKILELLSQNHLQRLRKTSPHYHYFVSDDPKKFQQLGTCFFGKPLDHVALCAF